MPTRSAQTRPNNNPVRQFVPPPPADMVQNTNARMPAPRSNVQNPFNSARMPVPRNNNVNNTRMPTPRVSNSNPDDNNVLCACNQPAILLTVRKQNANFGKFLYIIMFLIYALSAI